MNVEKTIDQLFAESQAILKRHCVSVRHKQKKDQKVSKKYVLNFNRNAKALSGEDLLDERQAVIHLGKFFATRLSNSAPDKAPVVKLLTWATAIYKNEPLELSESDFVAFKEFIPSVVMPVILAAQVMQVVEHAAAQSKEE